jgi:cytochrome c-type biogenesis protein CcsB
MINIQLYNTALIIYCIASFLYAANQLLKDNSLEKIASGVACFGLIIHIVAFITRWITSYKLGIEQIPVRGLYQGLTFLAGSSVLLYLVIEFKTKNTLFGLFVLPLVSLLMSYAALSPNVERNIVPLPAVLRGNYIISHMLTWFCCYTFLLISFVVSVIIFFKEREKIKHLYSKKKYLASPQIGILDQISYITVALGFIMLSIGIVTGMFRTNIIWGTYWNWDATQTWSLVTWLIYALVIHGRLVWGWEGLKTAMLSIIGFIIAIYTFLVGAGFISSSGHYAITS